LDTETRDESATGEASLSREASEESVLAVTSTGTGSEDGLSQMASVDTLDAYPSPTGSPKGWMPSPDRGNQGIPSYDEACNSVAWPTIEVFVTDEQV